MSDWVSSSEQYLTPAGSTSGDPNSGGRAGGDPWREEAARAGRVGAHTVILVARRVPAERVTRLLGIAPDEPAVLRRRLVTLDGVPVEVSDSWYPARVADGTPLAEDRPIKGGAVRALAARGYVAARHVEEVAVVDVPAELSTLLPQPPVIELTRASYTAPAAPADGADPAEDGAGIQDTETAFEVAVMLMSREMAPGVPRRLRYTFTPGSMAGS